MLYLADCDSEQIREKLLGRKEVEEAFSQLEMLTKEESLMVLVRNLEIAQHVDDNVKAMKVLTEDIDGNVKTTKVLVEDNAKGIEGIARRVENGAKHFLFISLRILTLFPSSPIIVTYELKRLSPPDTLLLILKDDTRSQGT